MIPEYKPWTAAEEEILRQLWTDRKSAEEIGKAMERTKNAIIARACKLQLGNRKHKKRGPDTLNQVRRMVREGMSTGAIAKALDFHCSKVREWRRQMGISAKLSDFGGKTVFFFPTAPAPSNYELRPAEKASDGGNGIAFGTARHGECKWPLWADADRTGNVCGCAAIQGRPYCEAHSARAFRAKPVQPQAEAV